MKWKKLLMDKWFQGEDMTEDELDDLLDYLAELYARGEVYPVVMPTEVEKVIVTKWLNNEDLEEAEIEALRDYIKRLPEVENLITYLEQVVK
jgi:hypothetical protein